MPSHITTKKPLCASIRSKHSPHSIKRSQPREQLKIKRYAKAHIIRIVGIERTHMTHTRTHATHTYTRIHAHTHHTRMYTRTRNAHAYTHEDFCHRIVTEKQKKFIHKAKPSIHKETLDMITQSELGLPKISAKQKLKTNNMQNFKFTIGQESFTRSFIVNVSNDTFGQVLGTLSFRLHQQLCLAKGSKLGKGIDLRKPFFISVMSPNDVLLTSLDSVWYGDATSTGLTAKGQQRFGKNLAKAMYEILLDRGFDSSRLADISEVSFTMDDQQTAIRSLMDERFIEVIDCL